MSQQDKLILLASLAEAKEAYNELLETGNPNQAELLKKHIFERALRWHRGEYFDSSNGTTPHTG